MSLVFPTYNPGPGITRTWAVVEQFLHESTLTWEVIFVCDGCTDGTPERLAELSTGHPAVRILVHTPNRGKGYAVRTGLMAARGAYRIFSDVDLAYSFPDILKVAQALRNGAEVAIASRAHPESRVVIPTALCGYASWRHLQSLVFASLARCLLPIRQRDTQAGLKGLTAEAVNHLVPALQCDGFGFDCELLTACSQAGLAVVEIPVCVRMDAKSTTQLATIGRMLGELWRIRQVWQQPRVEGFPLSKWRRAA